MNEIITNAYSGDQSGGDLPYFVGKQYGSGWLRTVARFAFPLIKKVLKSAGKVAVNTAGDMLEDNEKPLGQTLRKHALKELLSKTTSINRGQKRKRRHQSSSRGTIFSKRPRK